MSAPARTSADRAAVRFVLPAGAVAGTAGDWPVVSGGNRYDARCLDGLRAAGRTVRLIEAGGAWPRPAPGDLPALARRLAGAGPGEVLLVDGLVGVGAAGLFLNARPLVVLLHMPFGHAAPDLQAPEQQLLEAADAVVTTSEWTRTTVLRRHPALDASMVVVARPGVDRAPLSVPSPAGSRLLVVGAVVEAKGADRVLTALRAVARTDPGRAWSCRVVGPLDREPDYVRRLHAAVGATGLADRFQLVGVLRGAELAAEYAAADLLVSASSAESYGMALTEALAGGVPVIATAVGGVGEALGSTPLGRPGLLVADPDPAALEHALREWFDRPELRERLRAAARARREDLPSWSATVAAIEDALALASSRGERTRPEVRMQTQEPSRHGGG